jgi:hypothetical protein
VRPHFQKYFWQGQPLSYPFMQNDGMKELIMPEGPQMEFELNTRKRCRRAALPHTRAIRATWFNRMREVVENAIDWKPAPPCRPEQIWFPAGTPGSRRA